MGNLKRYAGFLSGFQGLGYCLDEMNPFVAHVSRIVSSAFSEHGNQLGNLLFIRIGSRRIDQAGGNAERSFLDSLCG